MNPAKAKKIAVLIPTFVLAILLVQQNYSWIFGLFIGVSLALSSCELIQKAVNNTFVRKSSKPARFFLIGFFFRFVIFALLLYASIMFFQVSVVAITLSFTAVQLLYPIYLVRNMEG